MGNLCRRSKSAYVGNTPKGIVPTTPDYDYCPRDTTGRDSPSSNGSKRPRGKPFPRRRFFCKLSPRAWSKLEELFHKLDPDGSNVVTREEARKFFKGTFGKISADAMFNRVDKDESGAITADEFAAYWLHVRKKGYTEKEIMDEVENMLAGGPWVAWRDANEHSKKHSSFPSRPLLCRLSVQAWSRCEDLFRKMDSDQTMVLTPPKAKKHFKPTFAAVSAEAMFNEIDPQHHGQITPKEFMAFWEQVRMSGYKEKDILAEVENLIEGESWVDWKDTRRT